MLKSTQGESDEILEPILDCECSLWRASSQQAADLYNSGTKLWRKADLIGIEQQLTQSLTTEKFIVRRIDGSIIHIKNPMFGVQKPIWKPIVKFQEYWRLVRTKPTGPPATYHCTYFIDWHNPTNHDFEGPFNTSLIQPLFEDFQTRWNSSSTCKAFTSQLQKVLENDGNGGPRAVSKIICFGLGDLHVKPWPWWVEENKSKPENEQLPETNFVEGALIQHAVALTMVNIVRSRVANKDFGVRLLTQDPAYTIASKTMLQQFGFEFIGEYGAAGFAELDDKSIVFSPFAAAPVQQIIADFARPTIYIRPKGRKTTYLRQDAPVFDASSPRTEQMWKEYETWNFPANIGSEQLSEANLHNMGMYYRTVDSSPNRKTSLSP